ncbi:MAG: AzlC family ABC transporter permease [Nitrospinae bacterium]|nr:AzlC family ABC transporter permease [Nitrospinota bacterium]
MEADTGPHDSGADFRSGARACLPALPTLFFIFAGFGVAAREGGVPAEAALLMTALVYAAPAQYAMLDAAGAGASALSAVMVGVTANLRFFVMSLTLRGMFRHAPRRATARWAHFVAATPFLLTFFRSRREKPGDLFAFYRGVSVVMIPPIFLGTVAGWWAGGGLPPALAFGGTLFMPVYFSLLIASDFKGGREAAAVIAGFLLTPPLETLAPGWGLLGAGLVTGGALAVRER